MWLGLRVKPGPFLCTGCAVFRGRAHGCAARSLSGLHGISNPAAIQAATWRRWDRIPVEATASRLAQFGGSWMFLPRPYKTGMFWMSVQGCIHSASWEEHPTSGESLIESFKNGANRTPGYGCLPLRHAARPSMARSGAGVLPAHGLSGRHPHPGLGFSGFL